MRGACALERGRNIKGVNSPVIILPILQAHQFISEAKDLRTREDFDDERLFGGTNVLAIKRAVAFWSQALSNKVQLDDSMR